MAYEGPEYWYVIYKAVADFGSLMRDAAQAKSALQGMADAVKAESAAEVTGAEKAASARQKDIVAIQQEAQALTQLSNSAKQTNVQLLYGGRNDMTQHISDLAQELNYTTLLNRQRWLGFSSVQQAMSYRQQMYQLALLENKAHFAGYLTADQYLGFLQRETAATSSLSASIRDRSAAIGTETSALLAHTNALQGTHQTAGQLGEQLSSVPAFAAALSGVPALVRTQVIFDDGQALAEIAAYRASLSALPHAESTDITSVATRLGGVSLDRPRVPVQAEVTGLVPGTLSALGAAGQYAASWKELQQAVVGLSGAERQTAADAYLTTLSQRVLGASLQDSAKDADALSRALDAVQPPLPNPEDVAAWEALAEAERGAGTELVLWGSDAERARQALIDLAAAADQVPGTLGMGGATGGGGGGGPPPRALPPGASPEEPPPGDAAAWEELGKAERDAVPHPEDAAAWEELGKAESDAKMSAAEAVSALQDAARAAAASGDAASASRFAWAAYAFQLAAAKAAGTSAADDIANMARLAATSNDAAKAAQLAFAAQNLLASSLTATAAGAKAAGGALPPMVDGLVASTGGFFGLNSQLRLFGGLLPGALGSVSLLHVVFDAIIEALAVLIPAIVTMAAGLVAFGIAGSAAATQVYDRLTAVRTVVNATGQSIAPLTGQLSALQDKVRPQVWQLYGDAITIAQSKTGLFNRLATETGAVLDRLAARVTVDMTSAGSGLNTFFNVGAQDLAKIGIIFHNLGLALLSLIKVTQQTHIDQIFLNIFVALSKLLDLITRLPTPVLAALVGLHAFYLWGGLMATVVLQLLGPLRSLALALGGVEAASVAGGLAFVEKDAGAWPRLQAGLTDIAAGFSALAGRILGVGSAARTAATDAAQAAAGVAVSAGAGAVAAGAVGAGEAAAAGAAAGTAARVTEAAVTGLDKAVPEAGFEAAFSRMTEAVTGFGAKVKNVFAAVAASISSVAVDMGAVATKVAAFTEPDASALAALAANAKASGTSVEDLARSTSTGASMLTKYGAGLDAAGQSAVALAIHSGASETRIAELAKYLGTEGAAAAGATASTGGFAGMLSKLGPVLGNVWVDLGLLIAALIGVGVYLGLRTDQTRQWTNALGAAIDKASAFTVVSTTVSNLAAVTNELNLAQRTGVGNATELAAAQQDLSGKLGTELAHVGDISRAYGTNFLGALELLNTAGIKTSDIFGAQGRVWEADLQQVQGLVQGYKAMGQGLTELQQDVSVQLVATSDQVTAMGKLNQAWDTFQQLVAAPLTTILTLAQGFATFATDAKASGAAMTGLSAPALTLQQQFQTLYGNVQATFDAMRNSEAVTGASGFDTFVKNAVQALLPLAGSNKAAAAEISQLAQEAGGPATTNLKSLATWAGNTKNPLLAMYGAAQQAVIGASNLSADAQRLTTTLQQDLNPAMATAIFNAHGGQAVFSTFADELAKSGPKSQPTINAAKNVASELLAVSGNSANAKANFVGFAEAMGLNSKQADTLWTQATTHMSGNLKQVRDSLAKTASATVDLSKPGLWGQVEHAFMSVWDTWRQHPLAALLSPIGVLVPQVRGWMDAIGHDITNFFTNTVPHAAGDTIRFFTQTIPHAWDLAWADLASPVIRGFDRLKSFVASSFDTWWKTHGEAVKAIWAAVWQAMERPAVALFNAVKSAATQFWDFLSSGPGGHVLKALWSNFAQEAAGAWHDIERAAQVAFALMTTLFTGIGHAGQAAWQLILLGYRAMWSVAEAFAKIAWDVIVAIISVAIDIITGHWHQAWADILTAGKQVWNTLKSLGIQLFTDLMHAAYGIWVLIFKPIWGWFNSQFVQPLAHFFTSTLPGWWNTALLLARTAWSGTWSSFNSAVLQPLSRVFTVDVPNWWGSLLKEARSTWSSVWVAFDSTLLGPLDKFFTSTLHGWWNDISGWARTAWSAAWTDAKTFFVDPITTFFTKTLFGWTTSIGNWFNTAWSTVEHFFTVDVWNPIKSLLGLAGGGVPAEQARGSVSGPADSDNKIVKVMGGEYVLRQPARMALEAVYGRGFLDYLNQYDTVSGAGSRGIMASQQGHHPGGIGRYQFGGIINFAEDVGKNLLGTLLPGVSAPPVLGKLEGLLKSGAGAAFNAILGAFPANNLVEDIAKGLGEDAEKYFLGQVGKSPVVKGSIQAKAAAASFGTAGPGGGTAGQNQALAKSLMPAWATGEQWASWDYLWNRESGWNQFAYNASSGATGIPQALPYTKMPRAAWLPSQGGSANVHAQETWGIGYIQGRYGSPYAAALHEQAYNWYAAGGPVASAVKAATSNREAQQAMALGAYLLSRWDPKASVPKLTEYGPWLIPTSKHKGLTVAQAENPTTAARLVAPYYGRGIMNSTAAEWKAAPAAAAMYAATYAAHAAGTSWAQPSTAALNTAWAQVLDTLNPPPPTPGTTDTINQADVKGWQKYAPKLRPDWVNAWNSWEYIYKIPRARNFSARNWATWLAQRGVMSKDEASTNKAVDVITAQTSNPQVLHAADFTTAINDAKAWQSAIASASLARSWHPDYYAGLVHSAGALESDLSAAYNAWHGIWGTEVVPGVHVQVPGAGTTVVDLGQYIVGGPAGGPGSGGLGFAGGGGLSDVAAMFAGGMAGGGVVPGLSIPGLSATLQKQLSSAAQSQQPRTLSDAAGDTVGLQVGNLTINNPVPERPSDSITRSSNRLAFMAGRGIA